MMTQDNAISVRQAQEVSQVVDRESLLDLFIGSQDRKPTTLSLYRRTLNLFFDWVDSRGYSLNTLTRPQVIEYKDSLVSNGKSALTITSYLTSVRLFYQWVEAEGVYPNIAKVLNLPKRKKEFRHQPLRPQQAQSLLREVRNTNSLRDFALVNLMLRTGLRCVETTRLNVEDIKYKGGLRVLMIQGKGRDEKDNFVILTDKAYQPIADYLKERGPVKPTDPMFVSESNRDRGQRMTTRSVSRIAKENLKGIGLTDKVFTAHSLRHTTAVSILRAGGTLEDCQLTLRHTNPATTEIYTAFADEERRLERNVEGLIDSLY
jgi:integrase/recombinase XerD